MHTTTPMHAAVHPASRKMNRHPGRLPNSMLATLPAILVYHESHEPGLGDYEAQGGGAKNGQKKEKGAGLLRHAERQCGATHAKEEGALHQ